MNNDIGDTKICEECGGKMLWCEKHKLFHHEDSYKEECYEYENSITSYMK